MQRLRFDPLKKLVEQANRLEVQDPNSSELRGICIDLLPYAYGKIKQLEHTFDLDTNVTVVIGGQPLSPTKGEDDGT
ncbi:hypothetical protein [Tropicibacter sp. Alg240-R139]|uniref:hypothetical protein n=1 Tax=Tropicibacter sp. Alg240-R139 TaxID=2305991 RepID=UPI001967548C|nr:hypothetical protein [Tropicibacter sp. Alg240-R139]